jgi:hypothetical protein
MSAGFVHPSYGWELNVFFGVGNEEDKAFRRYGDSAKPLEPGHEEEEW